ncbi:MAG TPA: DUF72 domain-containing protein [Sporichthya sp.]|jgi:uncharacterized protein YecE (DUF72 family)|nr:DUF72 domain-containing protein [Sporichthya sp.]
MTLWVGTSGWQYRDWRGVLYPPGCPTRKWLAEYVGHFATVENNNAFYRLPELETFARWRNSTPPGFVMAVKASRYLTHIKRLREPAEPVARLLSRVEGLGDRLGPILLQLPPTLKADHGLLAECLRQFPSGVRVAVEPRHESWWTEATAQLLTEHQATLVWADRNSRRITPLWRTTDWGYVRFHAGSARPWPKYGPTALRSWLDRIMRTWDDDADVFVYFNNDPGGAAVANARTFITMARHRGRAIASTNGSATSAEAGPARSGT